MLAETGDLKLWVPEHVRTQPYAEPKLYVPGYGPIHAPKASSTTVRISAFARISAGVRLGLAIASLRRRGPQPRTAEAWTKVWGKALAEHAELADHHPLTCDFKCLSEATIRSKDYLTHKASELGVRLSYIQTEAWVLRGSPPPTFGKL
jgi:hypothetical protein